MGDDFTDAVLMGAGLSILALLLIGQQEIGVKYIPIAEFAALIGLAGGGLKLLINKRKREIRYQILLNVPDSNSIDFDVLRKKLKTEGTLKCLDCEIKWGLKELFLKGKLTYKLNPDGSGSIVNITQA
jgi:hypothetical protein